MGTIADRLSKIKYQEKKGKTILPVYDDEAKLKAVQSLYDAAINDDTMDLTGEDFPTQIMGVDITWSSDRTIVSLSSGADSISNDDLTDDIVPDLDDGAVVNPLAFEFDSDTFELRSSEEFELRTA